MPSAQEKFLIAKEQDELGQYYNKRRLYFRQLHSLNEVIVMHQRQVSFCEKKMMSMCTADSDTRQKECCYYEKSCRTDKCMYFVFDEYCDCLKAQMNEQ